MRTGGIPISGNLHILLLLLFIIFIYYYYLLLLFIIIIIYYYYIYIYVAIYHQQLQYIINNMGIEYDRMGYFSRIQWDIQRNIFFKGMASSLLLCVFHGDIMEYKCE